MTPRPNDSHERLADGERPAPGSDRAFGVAFAALFAVVGAVAWIRGGGPTAWPFVVSGAFLVAALLTPELLTPLNAAQAKLSLFHRFVSGACSIARSLSHCFYPPPRHGFRRFCYVIWWNILLLTAGLLLVAGAGEAYFRLKAPFHSNDFAVRFVPTVGYLFEPNKEMRFTNHIDFWITTRTNSLGFLDREPTRSEHAGGCSVIVFGDSYVEARQVDIENKFHVRLEEMANVEYPALNVTTTAFGIVGTAQTHQLPLYDEYASPLAPDLVALVFVSNDFKDNSPLLYTLDYGYDPDTIPFASAKRGGDGVVRLLHPHSEEWRRLPKQESPFWLRALREADSKSLFVGWLRRKARLTLRDNAQSAAWAYEIADRPGSQSFLDGWNPSDVYPRFRRRDADRRLGVDSLTAIFFQPELPPTFQEALRFTAFGLDEFQRRAERDGASLVILATDTMGPTDDPLFQRLAAMAGERGIPVINQSDYIERVGGNVEDAQFKHNWHWNAQGHQWAAEALMEWLRENPDVCDDNEWARLRDGYGEPPTAPDAPESRRGLQ